MKKIIIILAAAVLAAGGCKKFNSDKPIVPVNGISLDYEEIVLCTGDYETLTATVSPSNATYKSVTWTSSNTYSVTVDGSRVTGVARGTSNVTATSTAPDIKAVCKVTVVDEKVPVTAISIEPATVRVKKDAESHAYVRYTPSGTTERRVEWSVDNTSIATVDANGNVRGVSVGETTLRAKSKDNPEITASATILVVKPFESITITNPANPSAATDLGYDETLQIKYTFTPTDSRDAVTYELVQGPKSKIEVSATGLVKAKGYSNETCKVRVSSVADPTVYTDVSFKPYDAPSGIEIWHKGNASRRTMYIGTGYSQTFGLRIANSSYVKPGTKISMWGPDTYRLHATLNEDGTEMTVGASSSSTSTTSSKISGNIRLYAGDYPFDILFYISEYDAFHPKIGDAIYYNNKTLKLDTADSGYRGGGIYEDPVNGIPTTNTVRFGIIGFIGDSHLSEDPFAAACDLQGIGDNHLHGIAIPHNADYVCRKDNPYNLDHDWNNGNWSVIPYSNQGGEIFSKDHDNISSYAGPVITGFYASRLLYSTSNSAKRLAFHNTIGLLYYNMGRGDSHRVHQALYVSSSQALNAFGGDLNNSIYYVSNQYYFGRSNSNDHLNANAYLSTAPDYRATTPWLLPTVADLKTVFAGNPSALDNSSTVAATVKERTTAFAKAVALFSINKDAVYRNYTYWTSQEYSAQDAMALYIYPDGTLSATNQDKNETHKCLPVLYF